jgi:hypothetical protein
MIRQSTSGGVPIDPVRFLAYDRLQCVAVGASDNLAFKQLTAVSIESLLRLHERRSRRYRP